MNIGEQKNSVNKKNALHVKKFATYFSIIHFTLLLIGKIFHVSRKNVKRVNLKNYNINNCISGNFYFAGAGAGAAVVSSLFKAFPTVSLTLEMKVCAPPLTFSPKSSRAFLPFCESKKFEYLFKNYQIHI